MIKFFINMNKFIFILLIVSFCFNSQIFKYNKINFFDGYNNSSENNIVEIDNNKFISMGMSFIIPGTGQIYQGNWKKGVAFLGIELLLWNHKMDYDNKGDYYVDLYKEFANENWSFENWVDHYYSFINENDPVYETMINPETCILNTTYENSNGHSGYCAPWYSAHYIEYYNEQTDVTSNTRDASSIHQLFSSQCDEGDNYYLFGCTMSDGDNFFNNIVVNKDHHFYEGIGKYNLFFAGWEDVNECLDVESGNLVESESCRWTSVKNGYKVALSNYKNYYQHTLRAKSNEKYDYAENALTLIFINHLASMLDSFLFNLGKDNKGENSFYTSPLYNIDNNKVEGLQLNLKW